MSETRTSGFQRLSSSNPSAADPATRTSAAGSEHRAHDLVGVGLIIDDQDAEAAERRAVLVLGRRAERGMAAFHLIGRSREDHAWQLHGDSGGLPFAGALRVHRTTVQFDDVADDRQPESKPAVASGGA